MTTTCLRYHTKRWYAIDKIERLAENVHRFTAREVGLDGATVTLLRNYGDIRKLGRLKKPWVCVWKLEKRMVQR